jgi:hypothetical protein
VPGLAAGLAAGVVAILVSLPLRSPHDAALNSATVGIASLASSIVLSVLWVRLKSVGRRTLTFAAICAAAIVTSLVVAAIAESALDLERTVGYVVPLASLEFGIAAVTVPAFSRYSKTLKWLTVPLIVAVVGLGLGLSSVGDEETGRLELPPPASS